MNHIENWTDPSLVEMKGWTGSISYDLSNHHLILTAINGWRVFSWYLPHLSGKNITFEFDYKFLDTTNSFSAYVTNTNDNSFGSSKKNMIITTHWTHLRCDISSALPYIGINNRGHDDTGETSIIALKNVRIYDQINFNNQLYKNGNFVTSALCEESKLKLYQSSLNCTEIIEM